MSEWSAEADWATWYRLAFGLIDVLLIAVLLRWLRREGRSAWWAVAYAWNPLTVVEVAWSGHQEPIGVLLMVLGLSVVAVPDASSLPPRKERRSSASALEGAFLAMAVAVKPLAGVAAVLGLIERLGGSRPRFDLRGFVMLLTLAATLMLLYRPVSIHARRAWRHD